jgi:hypothetical protein
MPYVPVLGETEKALRVVQAIGTGGTWIELFKDVSFAPPLRRQPPELGRSMRGLFCASLASHRMSDAHSLIASDG